MEILGNHLLQILPQMTLQAATAITGAINFDITGAENHYDHFGHCFLAPIDPNVIWVGKDDGNVK